MNSKLFQLSARLSITPKPCHPERSLAISSLPSVCHPERSLAMSEANRQTESKDLARSGSCTGEKRKFRIAVRFFDEHETEQCPVSSRETATCEARHGSAG